MANIYIKIDQKDLRQIIKEIVKEVLSETPTKKTNEKEKELITSKQAAKILKISVQTFYNYKTKGLVKPSKFVGNKPRYYKKYIEQLEI